MLYLTTGREGSGKTHFTIIDIINFRKKSEESTGVLRKVYYFEALKLCPDHSLYSEVSDWIPISGADIKRINIPEQKVLEGELVLDVDFFDNGSILFIDEAHFIYPPSSPMSKKPDYINFLSLHRHSGLDIFLVTQDESKLPKIVRLSVKYHKHLTQLGSAHTSAYKSSDDGVLSTCDDSVLQKGRVSFKKEYFGLYESSILHTDNKTFFQRLMSLPTSLKVLIPLIILIFIFVIPSMMDIMNTGDSSSGLDSVPSSGFNSDDNISNSAPVSSDLFLEENEESPVVNLISVYGSGSDFIALFSFTYSGESVTISYSQMVAEGLPISRISDFLFLFNGKAVTFRSSVASGGEVKKGESNVKK